MLITSNASYAILSLKTAIDQNFTIKDLGLANNVGLTGSKPTTFPIFTQLKLSLDKGNPQPDAGSHRRLVGKLLYFTMTRPDISYAMQHLSHFVSTPKDVHMQAATHLLKYLKGTISKGLFYYVQPHLQMTGLSYADWVACLMTRKSLTGYCIFLGHYFVSWKTKNRLQLANLPQK
ncbi:retrovirus-related pol polyprotein from transposon TNT 1-94 [Tanacetum coccineum]